MRTLPRRLRPMSSELNSLPFPLQKTPVLISTLLSFLGPAPPVRHAIKRQTQHGHRSYPSHCPSRRKRNETPPRAARAATCYLPSRLGSPLLHHTPVGEKGKGTRAGATPPDAARAAPEAAPTTCLRLAFRPGYWPVRDLRGWLALRREAHASSVVGVGDAAAADGAGLLGGAADAVRAARAEPQPLRRGHGGRLPRLRAILPRRPHALPPRTLPHPRRPRPRPPLGRLRPSDTHAPVYIWYCIPVLLSSASSSSISLPFSTRLQ